jgi:hypothetical protein
LDGPKTSPFDTSAHVLDAAVFKNIWDIAYEGEIGRKQTDQIFVQAANDDDRVEKIYRILRREKQYSFHGEFLPHEVHASHFRVRQIRCYKKWDLEEPEYLTIHRWGNWYRIFQYDSVKEGSYVGRVAKAKWASRYGITNNARSARFVNDELKSELEKASLVGLTFLPVLWDYPEKAKVRFWQLSSSITMPRCLLPVLNVPEDRQPWTTYDDGGHFPQELVFRRSQVEAIEPFDVALTAPEEEIHCGPNSWTRTLVVSQRFRQVIKKLKLTTAELVPARLVADDWERPPSDHDRLRTDGL